MCGACNYSVITLKKKSASALKTQAYRERMLDLTSRASCCPHGVRSLPWRSMLWLQFAVRTKTKKKSWIKRHPATYAQPALVSSYEWTMRKSQNETSCGAHGRRNSKDRECVQKHFRTDRYGSRQFVAPNSPTPSPAYPRKRRFQTFREAITMRNIGFSLVDRPGA